MRCAPLPSENSFRISDPHNLKGFLSFHNASCPRLGSSFDSSWHQQQFLIFRLIENKFSCRLGVGFPAMTTAMLSKSLPADNKTGTMRALVFHGPNQIAVESVPMPKPSYGEAATRVTLTTTPTGLQKHLQNRPKDVASVCDVSLKGDLTKHRRSLNRPLR